MIDLALMHEHTWPAVQRGGERYLHDIAWYLQSHTDIGVRVVTARGQPRRDVIEGVPVDRMWRGAFPPLGRWSGRFPRSTSRVATSLGRHALRRQHTSAVHAFSANAAIAGLRARIPTIFTTVGAPDVSFARRFPRRWAITAAAARDAEAVTAVGRDAAERFADAVGREVLALQPGVRMERFPPRLQARTGPPRILFASTVEPANKGFRAVLEAFPDVLEVHPDATLVVAGPGNVDRMIGAASPAVRRARARIERCLPVPSELARIYADATVTVLVSRNEAFGLVLAESLACGTPIVASNEGGPAEILGHAVGEVGHAATPHDAETIAEAVIATISLAAEADTPARSRARAEQWGWTEAVGRRHEDLYRWIGCR